MTQKGVFQPSTISYKNVRILKKEIRKLPRHLFEWMNTKFLSGKMLLSYIAIIEY